MKNKEKSSASYPFRVFKYALIFSVLYILFNFLNKFFLTFGKIWVFLSSPFSDLEDYLPLYHGVLLGVAYNFLSVFILFSIAGFLYTKRNKLNSIVSPSIVLFIGVASSYTTSAINWFVNKEPSSGTSIIGITVAIYLIFYFFTFDFYSRIKTKNKIRLKKGTIAYILRYLSEFAFLLYIFTFYSATSTHIYGGLIALLLLLSFMIINKNNLRVSGFH